MNKEMLFRVFGVLGVTAMSLYVVICGFKEGRAAEAIALCGILTPMAIVLVGLLSAACWIPGHACNWICKKVFNSGPEKLGEQTLDPEPD